MGAAFDIVSRGYLAASPEQLPSIERNLKEVMAMTTSSPRERGVYAAIVWGIGHPVAWRKGQKPIKLKPIGTYHYTKEF